jgi:hypothetical protein
LFPHPEQNLDLAAAPQVIQNFLSGTNTANNLIQGFLARLPLPISQKYKKNGFDLFSLLFVKIG